MFQFVDQKNQATLILKKLIKQIFKNNGARKFYKLNIFNDINSFGVYMSLLGREGDKLRIFRFEIKDGNFNPKYIGNLGLDEESLDELNFIAEEYLRKFGPKKKDRQIQPIF